MTHYTAANFDLNNTVLVEAAAPKFVIKVPADLPGAEPLVYPEGHERAGKTIMKRNRVSGVDEPIGKSGIVLWNGKDEIVQAVADDGNGVIIINNPTQGQAQKIAEEVAKNPNPTRGDIVGVLTFCQQDLGIVDIYPSNTGYVGKELEPQTGIDGLYYKTAPVMAFFVRGQGTIAGSAEEPTQFHNGIVVVVKDNQEIRAIQPDAFLATHRNRDGRALTLGNLPAQSGAAAGPLPPGQ